jgi:hypothetical protein
VVTTLRPEYSGASKSSHLLPKHIFWEDDWAIKCDKFLILLVEAAGFEPPTP